MWWLGISHELIWFLDFQKLGKKETCMDFQPHDFAFSFVECMLLKYSVCLLEDDGGDW